ncbi:[NiFe]-hydrogenase assembly chaperone HybE [Pontibacterium granulatum]|uniref:[NiFe]-hydrogenase assembly chaperone HybE n=1 Tax=Pontibacterium granulatum TaxID=2036029 RepID=UPI00249A3871|nr:[NiFe]-hydrogenase assembly chaperone HybE [Pontibacterium granulatum]MDI3323299.1 [NiFe]-hydrogenase assembly chaperone HybE [Pontibacterium granulatum]
MSRVDALHTHFNSVAQRMADLPMYNAALEVACVGFQPYAEREIGVLVTPWCMNLTLFPAESDNWAAWSGTEIGNKQMIALPSGQYEGIFGWSELTGGFMSCSLFSPMFEFAEQVVALETAEAVMKAVFDSANEAPTDRQHALREQKAELEELKKQQEAEAVKMATPKPEKLSRRGFLTGGFARNDEAASS